MEFFDTTYVPKRTSCCFPDRFRSGRISLDLWCKSHEEAVYWGKLLYKEQYHSTAHRGPRPTTLFFHHTPHFWWITGRKQVAMHSMIWASDLLIAANILKPHELLRDLSYLHDYAHVLQAPDDLSDFNIDRAENDDAATDSSLLAFNEELKKLPYYFVEIHGELP